MTVLFLPQGPKVEKKIYIWGVWLEAYIQGSRAIYHSHPLSSVYDVGISLPVEFWSNKLYSP